MAQTGIREVRPPHEAVLDEMLARPFIGYRELSLRTGYTVSWLSQMIRSDCFQQEFRRRRGDVECNVLGSIQDRLGALSHLAIERMEEVLIKSEDPEQIVDAFDKVLHRTGYAPKTGPAPQPTLQQNNLFVVQREELENLRAGMLLGMQPSSGASVLVTDAEPGSEATLTVTEGSYEDEGGSGT